jgi:hypothetical protein
MSNFALPERLLPMCYEKICLISVSYSFLSYPVNPVDPVEVLRSERMTIMRKFVSGLTAVILVVYAFGYVSMSYN